MQKGMMDVVPIGYDVFVRPFRVNEVAGSIIDVDLHAGAVPRFVNKDSWNSLPQYIKDLWREIYPTYYLEYKREIRMPTIQATLGVIKETGIEVYKLSPEEEAKLRAAAKPMWEAWVAEMEEYPAGKRVREFLKDQIAYRNELTGEPWTIYTP